MKELEKREEEYDTLWNSIKEITEEVERVEKSMAKTGENKEERKDVANLRRQLNELEAIKKERKAEWKADQETYIEQQSKIMKREWILKQKKKLLKIRTKEAAAINAKREQYEKLIKSCYLILKSVNVAGDYVLKFQASKSKKRKRKEITLDELRDQFESLSISPPEEVEDIEERITQLQEKLEEISSRPLTEVLGIERISNSSSESSWSSGS
jgi:hypothetical protein